MTGGTADSADRKATARADLRAKIDAVLEAAIAEGIGRAQEHVRRPPDEMRWIRRYRTQLADRNQARWAVPLAHLETAIDTLYELGVELDGFMSGADLDFDRYGLGARMQMRGIQVALEVLVLLRSGYANGALARWRTLHEIAVVAAILAAGDDELIDRYIAYYEVEELRAANEAAEVEQVDEENGRVKRDRRLAELKERHGTDFTEPNGWARPVAPSGRISFLKLERIAQRSEARVMYGLASHATHAVPTSTLSSHQTAAFGGQPIAGPTNSGLATPGAMTLDSLVRVAVHTSMMMLDAATDPGIDVDAHVHTWVHIGAMAHLRDAGGDMFMEEHDRQVQQERMIVEIAEAIREHGWHDQSVAALRAQYPAVDLDTLETAVHRSRPDNERPLSAGDVAACPGVLGERPGP